jgi:CheY-like chemotaxis protein
MLKDLVDQRIIIAENDSMIRGILRSILEHPRRILFLAGDGQEAVTLAGSIQAALVLLDVRMPRLDGIAACRQIREMPNGQSVPIVLLTAFDGDRVRREAHRAGATAFLVKPFTTENLLRGLTPLLAAQQEAATRVRV